MAMEARAVRERSQTLMAGWVATLALRLVAVVAVVRQARPERVRRGVRRQPRQIVVVPPVAVAAAVEGATVAPLRPEIKIQEAQQAEAREEMVRADQARVPVLPHFQMPVVTAQSEEEQEVVLVKRRVRMGLRQAAKAAWIPPSTLHTARLAAAVEVVQRRAVQEAVETVAPVAPMVEEAGVVLVCVLQVQMEREGREAVE